MISAHMEIVINELYFL